MALQEKALAGGLQPCQPALGCSISILLKGEAALPFLPTTQAAETPSRTREPLAQTTAWGHRAREAAEQRLLLPELSPHGAKLPPPMWTRDQAAPCCLPRAAVAEVAVLPGESTKLALFCKKSARCIPGFGMNRQMEKRQEWMKKHSLSLRIIY